MNTAPAPGAVPVDDELVSGLYFGLARAVRWLRRSGAVARGTGPGGMSALATIAAVGPLRSGQLADREGVAASTMSRIVDSLAADSLVERVPDPADGRALLVRLTPAGQSAVDEVRTARAAALRDRLGQLPVGEREALRAAVAALTHLTEG